MIIVSIWWTDCQLVGKEMESILYQLAKKWLSFEESGFISYYILERKTNDAALLDDLETEDDLKERAIGTPTRARGLRTLYTANFRLESHLRKRPSNRVWN